MQELLFSDSDLDELILILQMSSYEADVAIGQSHDTEEIDVLRMHKRTANKWLNRFEQLKRDQAGSTVKDTPTRRSEGAKSGWEIRRAKQQKGGAG